jgi:CHAD domain-containing protein
MKNLALNSADTSVTQPILVLVKCLDHCQQKYRAELKRTRREFANEHVHDLRVSILRLMAAIEMGRAVVDSKRLKKTQDLLKLQLDAFDELRDTQVQLTIVEELQQHFAELLPYRDHLQKRERKLVVRLEKKLKATHAGRLARQVAGLRKALLVQELPESEAAVLAVADAAWSVVMERHAALRVDHTKSIHHLRLAFKKFRYMVENIYPLLPDSPDDLRSQLHNYQARMGHIQDAAVGAQMLADFAAKSRTEFPAAMTRFDDMLQARVQAFVEAMEMVKTFWRMAPDEKFPWQLTTVQK